MTIKQALLDRSQSKCELCGSETDLDVYTVPPHTDPSPETAVCACATCRDGIENPDHVEIHHWRGLNDTMWSQVPAVQAVIWRLLNRMRAEGWPQDLLDMLYLDEEVLAWAKEGQADADEEPSLKHVDANGTALEAGDTVTLIKDLKVKGGGFTAKRGTTVRGISLDPNNAKYIEGRVEGQHIVIIAEYVKKA